MKPEERIAQLEKRIDELERKNNTILSAAEIEPDLLNAIAQPSTSTPTAGYDGRFIINDKYVDYKDI